MNLVMFDMDGTLTDGFAIEENCYVLSIEQALGLSHVVTEWDQYEHTSASYCLERIVHRNRGDLPSAAESLAVQQRMVALMGEITARTGRRTTAIPGAADCMRTLLARGYGVAIASGDWEATARHKFTTAGIPFEGLPAAFCDVAHPRTEIMLASLARAQQHYGVERFERIVYVGDAAWDIRACRDLAWPLVAVASESTPEQLRALGANEIIEDYLPFEKFQTAMDRATPPRTLAV